MFTPRFSSLKRKQDGAALAVGLVVLVLLTILGISGMRTATLDLNMARNHKQSIDVFQAAESAIDKHIGTFDAPTSFPSGLTRGTVLTGVPVVEELDLNSNVMTRVTTRYTIDTMSEGGDLNKFSAINMRADVQAFIADGDTVATAVENPDGAKSDHTVGFYVPLAPK